MKALRLFYLIIFTILTSQAAEASREYESQKPFSKQVFKVYNGASLPKGEWDRRQKGIYAEKLAEGLYHAVGFKDCPAKYLSLGPSDAVGRRSDHPEQGIDGLFIKEIKDRKLIIVSESKFQTKGGAPKLKTMGCTTCSGGVGDTDQMSWRWIHHAVESVLTESPGFCTTTLDRRWCSGVCSKIIEELRVTPLEDAVYRVATVVDKKGTIHFYSLYSSEDEMEATETVLLWMMEQLRSEGYKIKRS